MKTIRRLGVALLVIVSVAVSPAAASADVYDKFAYSDSASGTFEDCGTQWAFDIEVSGFVLLRLDDDGDILLFQDNSSFSNTVTNLETGRHITFDGHSLFREVESVREGNILTVDVRQSGVPVVATDDSGTVVHRDRGLLVLRQTLEVIDHDVEFISEEVVADHGGHPLYFLPFCDVALPATA